MAVKIDDTRWQVSKNLPLHRALLNDRLQNTLISLG